MSQKPADETKIGELLLRNRVLSEEQLSQALMVQQNHPTYKPLGEVCMDLGFISRTRLRTLLKMGKISETTLMSVLSMQQEAR